MVVIVLVIAALHSGGEPAASSPSTYRPASYSYTSPGATLSPSSVPTTDQPTSSSTGGSLGPPEHNRVYRTAKMKNVHCGARLRTTTTSAYRKYLYAMMPCLNRAWKPVLASQGIPFSAPRMVAKKGQPSSPCGGGTQAGYAPAEFYCDGTIYVNVTRMVQVYRNWHRDWLLEVPAHEYGHHIQTLYGLWPYYDGRFDPVYPGHVAKYTKLSRRMELQAQCFAGVYMSHNRMGAGAGVLKQDASALGDNWVSGWRSHPEYRNHGQGYNTERWFTRGFDADAAHACNTWTASSKLVA